MEGERGTGQEALQAEGQAGGSSAGEESSPSTPKTYTEEQVGKIQSGLDKQVVKLTGEVAKQTDALKLSNERVEQLQREREETELKEIGDDPDALTLHNRKKALRDGEAELAKDKTAFEKEKESNTEALADLGKAKRVKKAEEIATRHNVDAKLLLKHGGEDMEALAQDLPKLGEKKQPDSGGTIGSATMPESAKDKMRAGWDELHK